ncbi:MAG: hypothetical protein AAB883_00540 [Patescibacteria group bacterium]
MDNQKTISEKVLNRIMDAKTAPRSRLYFMLRNSGMWLLAFLSIVLGALAISSFIFRAVNTGPALRPGLPPIPEILLAVPFLWIICIAVFGYLAYREVRSTRRGYRYELTTLLLATILASGALGIVFYATGVGFMLDRAAAHYLPFHTDLERVQRDRWLAPREGFLVGAVRLQEDEDTYILQDPEDIEWTITFATTIPDEKLDRLEEGQRIGVEGEILDIEAHTFLACDIRSLEFEGRGFVPPHTPGERKNLPPRTNGCEDVRPLD